MFVNERLRCSFHSKSMHEGSQPALLSQLDTRPKYLNDDGELFLLASKMGYIGEAILPNQN